MTVHAGMHPDGSSIRFLYRGDWSDAELRNPPEEVVPVKHLDGRAAVRIDLPPAGMAILA